MTQGRPFDPDVVAEPPTPWSLDVVEFVSRLSGPRDSEGLVITSWFRSPADNERVGGADGSLHLEGLAVDVDKFGADLDVYEALARDFVDAGLAVLVYYDEQRSYLHVQSRPLLSGRVLSVVT